MEFEEKFFVGNQPFLLGGNSELYWKEYLLPGALVSQLFLKAQLILDPIMFLFCVNNVPEIVSTNAKLFNDDCKLYNRIRNCDDCTALQDDLGSIVAWFHDWWLRFTKVEKCITLCCIKTNSSYPYAIEVTTWNPVLNRIRILEL